jgi:hypothetical protein
MGLSERKEVLEKSGLCLFCLKHAAELECYGRGGLSKPRCTQAGCDGEHTPGVHKLMGEERAGVNLVAEDESELEEDEDEDEEWWVGTIGVIEARDEEEEAQEEMGKSEPDGETQLITNNCTRRSDSGLEDESECPLDLHTTEELRENGWWSPEPPQPSSEESEEEAQYLARVWDLKPRREEPTLEGATGGPREGITAPDRPWKEWPPHPKGVKRRRLRKKTERTRDQEWERARQDAWLRKMLSDTSSSEDEESCGRFAESGRWVSELFKISQHPETTSGGECSGQKKPDST